jgi:hypothetical protein
VRLLITFVALSMTTWAADFLGTWKWNLEKTTLTPLPKAATTTREANGPDGVKSSTTITSQSGAVNTWGYTAKYDGKEYSVTGNQNFDTIALKREDANTTRIEVHKKGGKYHTVGRAVVSQDGKTVTLNTKGTDKDGKPLTQTIVYEKQ